MQPKLHLEGLESRVLPAAKIGVVASILSIVADNKGDNITVSSTAGQVNVTDNGTGKVTSFSASAITSVSFLGGNGSNGDFFQNTTALPDVEQAGYNSGTTYLQGGTTKSILIGSMNPTGSSYLTAGNGNATFIGGAGFNNIFGGKTGGADTIITGPGTNYVYDILGTDTVIANGGKGYLIVDAQSAVVPDANYSVITFFQAAQTTPTGSPFLLQKDVNGNGILYINPQTPNSGVTESVTQIGNQLLATYTDVNGTQIAFFPAKSVQWVASFGTTGNDSMIVNANVNSVLYGAAGNDYLQGGTGIDVLKSHSGNDVLNASSATYADLSAGTNGSDTLIGSSSSTGFTVFRNRAVQSTNDVNVGKNDLVINTAASTVKKVILKLPPISLPIEFAPIGFLPLDQPSVLDSLFAALGE